MAETEHFAKREIFYILQPEKDLLTIKEVLPIGKILLLNKLK
jgi:hypothetical protein